MIPVLCIFLVSFLLLKLHKRLYALLWDKTLAAELFFNNTDAFEGQTVGFTERISNGKRFTLPYLLISYKLPMGLKQLDINGGDTYTGSSRDSMFCVPANKSMIKKTKLVCEKRGYYEINNATVSSANVLLTGGLGKNIALNINLTVYPREIQLSETVIPYKQISGEILTKRYILPDPFEFSGVREYQPFDSFKQINFKAWAKTGELMSNVYGHTVSQVVSIILNVERYSLYSRTDIYENAIRLAAFLARHFTEAGIPVAFATNGVDCVTGGPGTVLAGSSDRHLREIYEILARIDLARSGAAIPITRLLPEEAREGSVVILVSSNEGKDITRWYLNAKEAGASAVWIIPRTGTDPKPKLADGDVIVWEADDD